MTDSALPSTADLVETARDSHATLQAQHAAFTQLVERSQYVAFGLALSRLRDVEDARDAAQDSFAAAWLRLPQLRDASAFEAWMTRIVLTECNRRLRRRKRDAPLTESSASVEADTQRLEYQSLIGPALTSLSPGDRHVTVLFYMMGYSQKQIATLLGLQPGTVAKRLHSARLRIRRLLPPAVRHEFMRVAPTRTFVQQVRLGIFDEYVGHYRFARRPDLVVSIARQGDRLVSSSAGQHNVLTSLGQTSLLTSHYDGEGRFGRNRRGEVTHFTYYEFGRRLGVAWKTDGMEAESTAAE